MSIKTIYAQLRAAGMTREGACGLMGNMMAESAMIAGNAQDSCHVDDEAYTSETDSGLNDFAGDGIGYGLCQWTEASRKRKLLDYAKAQGCSVADEDMQVRFCIRELRENYRGIWDLLRGSGDLLACTREVLNVYENPAVKNLATRLEYARQAMAYFDYIGEEAAPREEERGPDPVVMAMQLILSVRGLWDEPDGFPSPAFAAALRAYIGELEAKRYD